MRKLLFTLFLAPALVVGGCDKKQTSSTSESQASNSAVPTSTASAEPTKSSAKTPSASDPSAKLSSQTPIKVPAQEPKTEAGKEEKGEDLTADVCRAVCSNAVALSLKSQKNAVLKEQLEAFGLEDCQKQCLKKGTKKQASCIKAAKTLKDLANCSF